MLVDGSALMAVRPYARGMDLHDTTRRMRELLLAQDVELSPEDADAAGGYEGRGAHAGDAWKAFGAVSAEAAFDPVDAWEQGALEEVTHAGFLFEAMFSQGWPGRHGRPAMPEHYELMFTRQFNIGDAGDMMGLHFTIFVPAADELRPLRERCSERHTDLTRDATSRAVSSSHVEKHEVALFDDLTTSALRPNGQRLQSPRCAISSICRPGAIAAGRGLRIRGVCRPCMGRADGAVRVAPRTGCSAVR